jgi:hypothetical protein
LSSNSKNRKTANFEEEIDFDDHDQDKPPLLKKNYIDSKISSESKESIKSKGNKTFNGSSDVNDEIFNNNSFAKSFGLAHKKKD